MYFNLEYYDVMVGRLSLSENGETWTFEYYPSFAGQNDVDPLFSFPDKTKPYIKSGKLWPYFLKRIPSSIKFDPEDNPNIYILLQIFGERVSDNPFRLVHLDETFAGTNPVS